MEARLQTRTHRVGAVCGGAVCAGSACAGELQPRPRRRRPQLAARWGGALLLLAACAALPFGAGCASSEPKKDPVFDEVAVRKGELLTPTAEAGAPPFGLPKPKRSPAAARTEEREDD